MQNTTDEYRKFRYYEGVCSSGDFIKEISKVLSLGVKKDAIKDADGNIITPSLVLRKKNWDIVYPTYNGNASWAEGINTNYDEVVKTLTIDQYTEKIENQIEQITNSVVLRTTTTEHEIKDKETEELSVSGDVEETKKTMYVQFYKPAYLANPEEYPLDAELIGLTPRVITKEMYKEARKTTASVIYDFTQLVKNFKAPQHEGMVTSTQEIEYVDSVSNAYERDDLFGEGILSGLKTIYKRENLSDIIEIPDFGNPTTYLDIDKVYLNSIKNNDLSLYNFIMGICGLRSTFTKEDYDSMNVLHMQITYAVLNNKDTYTITFTYEKKVEIFTIREGAIIDLDAEYGHVGIDDVKPEIYSEGRYIPVPEEYLGEIKPTAIEFVKELKFSLDKVTNPDIFYGTIVTRYDYDKNFNYVDLNSFNITDSVALPNNHYCLVRMFDNPALDFSGPNPNITDNEGNITTQNSHISPWSKLSWYRDFEEIMIDSIDEDISTSTISDGTLLVPLETAGLSADTRISYWINANNDRLSLIVMGNPALDYENDRHLISSCYIGRIDSFEGSINDTSGNFALYTSSSTPPCKTEAETNDTQYHLDRSYTNEKFVKAYRENDNTYFEEYMAHCEDIGGAYDCTDFTDATLTNLNAYYITLTGNKFFNENEMPRYMIYKDGEPVNLSGDVNNPVYYKTVAYRDFIYGSSDSRSNQVAIYINQRDFSGARIYFNFGYYEEKFIITSGVTRDSFGNVIDIKTIDEYGKNTSDGTTSVSMFHTRSKAFYQKHHFLFATTEEYMSKVMYGKSSYTGEYYADRIKITHGNDGPRGILSDVLVIDNSSLYPKDELVINKDFEKDPNEMEETFIYFPVTAPFSPFSDSPNARYGIALKKEEKEPVYTDYNKIINIAKDTLKTEMTNHLVVDEDVDIPSKLGNNVDIYWEVLDGSNWIEDNSDDSHSIEFYDTTGDLNSYMGRFIEANNLAVTVTDAQEITSDDRLATTTSENISEGSIEKQANSPTVDFISHIKVKGQKSIESGDSLYYGISEIDYGSDASNYLYTGTDLVYKVFDNFETADTTQEEIDSGSYGTQYQYAYYNRPVFIHNVAREEDKLNLTTSLKNIDIENADPFKFLNVFDVTSEGKIKDVWSYKLNDEESTEEEGVTTITKTPYDLLQYPCKVFIYITSGGAEKGILLPSNAVKTDYYTYNYNTYGKLLSIPLTVTGAKVAANRSHYYDTASYSLQTLTGSSLNLGANNDIKMDDDLYVNIQF